MKSEGHERCTGSCDGGRTSVLHGLFFWIFGRPWVIGVLWFFNWRRIALRFRFFDGRPWAAHNLNTAILWRVQ
jgi:hypothetical protein